MSDSIFKIDRRRFLEGTGAAVSGLALGQLAALEALATEVAKMETRPIPSTGERLPIVGLVPLAFST